MKAKTTNSSSGVKSRKKGFTYEELNYKILTDSTCAVDKSQVTGDLIIPEVAHYNDKDYSVTEIGKNAFNKCTDLETVVIPNSVTSIGKSAFDTCSDCA